MVILGLGSNLGDRLSYLSQALHLLSTDSTVQRISSCYASPALLPPDAPQEWDRPFINMIAAVETKLPPEALLHRCKAIEAALGRDAHHAFWSPRTIDIDILAYGDLMLHTPNITLPHPGIAERMFVLQPLAEILPEWQHPVTRFTARAMLKALATTDIPMAERLEEGVAFP